MEEIDELTCYPMSSLHLPLTHPLFSNSLSVLQLAFRQTFLLVCSIDSCQLIRAFFISGNRENKMLQRRGVVVALLLTYVSLICSVESAAPYIPTGRDKDAWPELLNMDVNDAISILNASGFVQNIYVQPPSSGPGPANIGKTSDVWIYTDGSTVYETPRRGVWHANRLIPGWPEVSGMWYKSAIAKIKQDYLGVTVVYGPKGSVFRTADLKMDRVYVDISNDSTVIGVPSVG